MLLFITAQKRLLYAFVFGFLSLLMSYWAVSIRGVGFLLLWPAVSFLFVAIAYAGLGAHVLGKREDGRIAPWAMILMLPFFCFAWTIWRLQCLLSREHPCDEVRPNLWLGRRLQSSGEIPAGVEVVVDFTAEFVEPRWLTGACDYFVVPTLDACIPAEDAFVDMLRRIAKEKRITYIHCANGHGRSAMFVSALLIVRGIVETIDEAEAMIKDVRPGARIHSSQRAFLNGLNLESVQSNE